MLLKLNDPVKFFRETASGDLIIHCTDHDSIDIIKNKLNKSDTPLAHVDTPKPYTPVVKIVGFEPDFDDNEALIKALYRQNPSIFLDDSKIEVVEDKSRKKEKGTARVRIDTMSFKRLMERKRVVIGWTRCAVYEYMNVWRCHKCQVYGHAQSVCTSTTFVCGHCSSTEHKTDDCKATEYKCVNCVKANEELKLNIPTDHCVWSTKCTVLSRKLQQRKKNIRYSEK